MDAQERIATALEALVEHFTRPRARLMSSEQAAAYLQVGRRRLLEVAKEHNIRRFTISQGVNSPLCFDRADLDEFIEERKREFMARKAKLAKQARDLRRRKRA